MTDHDVATTTASLFTSALQQVGERLNAADAAPRCFHVKLNGVRCGSPAMHGEPYCYFHERVHNPPIEEDFPFLEDANSVQFAIMQVLNGLRRNKLDLRTAGTMLYGLQTAISNLGRVRFEPLPWNVVTVDPISEAISRNAAEEADAHDEEEIGA